MTSDFGHSNATNDPFRMIVESSPNAIVMVNREGAIMLINPQTESMFGYSADELVGQFVEKLVPARHRGPHRRLRDAYLADPQARAMGAGRDLFGRRKDGTEFPVEIGLSPILTEQGLFVLAAIVDTTDRKHAEERARQAERLATIGQVVAGLAHESRNALQRSQAALEMLEFEVEGNPEAADLVARIQRAQNHLQQLFDEVRNYAAPVKLDRTECTLREIWREAWELLASQRADRQIEFLEDDGGLDLNCFVDRFRLVQVFRNLLENSLAACSDPVEVTIVCRAAGDDPDVVQVAVGDNGPGLEGEATQRVFEPFFTTRPKGTGLGMAIAQRIVDAHGGSIQVVTSAAAQGATFAITLPRGRNADSENA